MVVTSLAGVVFEVEVVVEPAMLLSVLFNDRDRAVCEDAVRALGQIGDARAVEFRRACVVPRMMKPVNA